MDLKGLQWLGNVYNKFEAMCVEMEEAMYQDTMKYVENQVQTVNHNVKRFCTEVVKDFHQDSFIDPVKVAAADLSLNPYAHDMKKIAIAKKEPRESCEKSVDESRVLISDKSKSGVYKRLTARKNGHSSMDSSASVCEPGTTLSGNLSCIPPISWSRESSETVPSKVKTAGSSCRVILESGDAPKKILNPTMDAEGGPVDYMDSPLGEANSSIELVELKESNLRPTSAIACSSSECAGEDKCVTSKVVSPTSQNQVGGTNTNFSESMEAVLISHQVRLDDCIEDVAKNTDITVPDMESIQQHDDASLVEDKLDKCTEDAAKECYVSDLDMELIDPYDDSLLAETCDMELIEHSSLAETCVLVERENLVSLSQRDSIRKSYKVERENLVSLSQRDSIHKSYKKKLREAFGGKKRSTRKEYEQLVLKYKDENIKKEQREEGCLPADTDANEKPNISPSDACSEPEWELL